MIGIKARPKVAFLSTYPPRECGIATFTQDLVTELNRTGNVDARVVAVSDTARNYGGEVLFDIDQQSRGSYIEAARRLNASDIDALVIEHEYGIFGGDHGAYVLDLVRALKLPIIATLHTVLSSPSDGQKRILRELCSRSKAVVVMAASSAELLGSVYGVPFQKVHLIHHGVPEIDLPPREILKEDMGFSNRTVVSTFGLIGPGKGLEYGIEAVEIVSRRYKDILYLILGQTHPVLKKQHGESYRAGLEAMVRAKNLENNVIFINRYLTKEEVIRYLKLSDIYMTPYLSREQAVSGTLAYAVGYGKAVVSTPYQYAVEMLSGGRGVLADFRDARSLSDAICSLIENPEMRRRLEEKAAALGRTMTWRSVAERYCKVINDVCNSFCGKLEVLAGHEPRPKLA